MPLDRNYIVVGWLADIRYERHDAGLVVGIAYTLYRENLAQKQLYWSLVSIQPSSLCIVAKPALLYSPNVSPRCIVHVHADNTLEQGGSL